MKRIFVKCIICISMLLVVGSGICQNSPNSKLKITGIYSNMQYNAESGDVLGQEIFIVFSRDGYFAILQNSEGEPAVPVVVPLKVLGSNIYFHVPSNLDSRGNFQGVITGAELRGAFSGNDQKVELKRKNSYWQ